LPCQHLQLPQSGMSLKDYFVALPTV